MQNPPHIKGKFVDIHPNARISPNVEIGSFATIEEDVCIGEGTDIGSHATLLSGTHIGKNCTIFPGAVIGAVPQDLKFQGEETTVTIGDHTTIREYATINRGTAAKNQTLIGQNCLLMAYSHIAHDCILGDHIIISNATQIAGEVKINDYAILSAGVLVHQFTQIGRHAMIQGGTKVNKDVPPFVMAARDPISYTGVNTVGLIRKGYTREQIQLIQEVYRHLYLRGYNKSQAIEYIQAELEDSKMKSEIIDFVAGSSRGIIRGYFN